jgi:ADP-heptose:LPS heptosyltransferase
LRERRYDVSVDFASGDRAAWLSLLSRVPRRIGLATPKGFRRFIHTQQFPVPAPQIHAVELYLAIARLALGVTTEDKALELHTSDAEEKFANDWLAQQKLSPRGFVVAHVGGRYRKNRWPTENWRRLIEAMPMPVVFIGAAQDDADTRAAIAGTNAVSLVGQTGVLQLAALLRRAAVFVGHDSGPMHIATAMGTRVVAFFGPASHPDVWRPWGDGHVVLPTSSSVEDVMGAAAGRG